jgi:uncharacterized protein YndB with AHSA1/START domain
MSMTDVQSVLVVERTLPHPPQKIWRALTTSAMLTEWLMPNDFKAEVGHRSTFRFEPQPHWNGIVACEVLACDPPRLLRCSWNSETKSEDGIPSPLNTVVTWTLTPSGAGTLLRLEQDGFGPHQQMSYRGAMGGWARLLDRLADLAGRLD